MDSQHLQDVDVIRGRGPMVLPISISIANRKSEVGSRKLNPTIFQIHDNSNRRFSMLIPVESVTLSPA
jgi:hypothetical protein